MGPPTANDYRIAWHNISLHQNSLSILCTIFSAPLHQKLNTSDLRRCQPIFNKMPDNLATGVTSIIPSMHHCLPHPISWLSAPPICPHKQY
eukprot:15160083-Ditylum_brightwellii.AAC.1